MTAAPIADGLSESDLRVALGIPADAERVLIFGETSHWDPNWLFTADQYFRLRIRHILDAALDELLAEPRRVFAVECMFFLRMYWEAFPERQDVIRQLVNERRLRLTGTGITTPDTVLPATEAILRDYLLGQEWLRHNGMQVEPRLAYLPDCFGHSPALPTLLNALGMDMAAITRIDGMFFVGSDFRPQKAFPLAGSSADQLTGLGAQDFVWRGPDGSEVLCHWNAFSYFQGDMLAHRGIIRWMGLAFGMPWRTARLVASRIEQWVAELQPLARTPYLFCPIGCDFNAPIPGLMGLLDRHNRIHYPDTGVWAVNAGMDDYLQLCDWHRSELPVVELDPNPYWMGFYASRPEAKQRSNRIVEKLVLAEKLATAADLAPVTGARDGLRADLEHAWDRVAVSNHHDFITGTAPDRTWLGEQLPWLREAEDHADRAVAVAGELALRTAGSAAEPTSQRAVPPQWSLSRGELTVRTAHYALKMAERVGGCIVEARSSAGDRNLLAGPSNDIVAYRDSGGLWRLGHEFRGGSFERTDRTSARPAIIEATERGGVLEVRIESLVAGQYIARWLWFRSDSPLVRMRLVGAAASRHTIACRFATALVTDRLTMDVPGGVVTRPARKLYDPTFWPARTFAHLVEPDDGPGLAAFLGGPACVSLDDHGGAEWIGLRNAPREIAYGLVPIPAHPASGTDPDEHAFDYAVRFTPRGGFGSNRLIQMARHALDPPLPQRAHQQRVALADSVLETDHADVLVTALKPAHRGTGIIARLTSYGAGPKEVSLRLATRPIRAAWLCDARERDRAKLAVAEGCAQVPLRRSLTTVRLLV